MEAITDPDVNTGWYDAAASRTATSAPTSTARRRARPDQLYNQVINGSHYLTQEEFSNIDFLSTGGGCLQSE